MSPFLLFMFLSHATCSVSMVILNKTLVQTFDYPWTVVFIQNVGTVALGLLWPYLFGSALDNNVKQGGSGSASGGSDAAKQDTPDAAAGLPTHQKILGLKIPNLFKNKIWTAMQTAFFMVMLFMSLKSLYYVSVPLYVVARNMVPAVTALFEASFLGIKIDRVPLVGLVFTILGTMIYTYGDFSGTGQGGGLDFTGLWYAGMLIIVVSMCSVCDKAAVKSLKDEGLTIVECNSNRVALSMPLNIVFIMLMEWGIANNADKKNNVTPAYITQGIAPMFGSPMMDALFSLSFIGLVCMFLTTIFGFGMGTFNFYLQQALSAATVQVANILYKLLTTVISRITHPAPVTSSSWIGYAVSLIGILLYTFGGKIESWLEEKRILRSKGSDDAEFGLEAVEIVDDENTKLAGRSQEMGQMGSVVGNARDIGRGSPGSGGRGRGAE